MSQNFDMLYLKKMEKSHSVENNEISNFEKEIKFNFIGASKKSSELNRKSQ